MELNMTEKQFRRLLDLVYIGNWVLNSTRGDDRIREYDQVESLVFAHCLDHGMAPLTELYQGELIPSRAFADGGIHEAIMAYEDTTFFEILAQELALRDMDDPPITPENYDEVMARMSLSCSRMGSSSRQSSVGLYSTRTGTSRYSCRATSPSRSSSRSAEASTVLEMPSSLLRRALYRMLPALCTAHRICTFHLPPMRDMAWCSGHFSMQGQS